jgi:MFS family permease
MIPFMGGIICSSFITGRIMSRTGRYKIFPIIGTAVMAVAMLLFSTLTVDTPIPEAMAFMVVMGIGLGLSMQTLVISVQNALPPRDMGIATSSVTFFRSMGATFGVAVALAILFGSVVGNIKARAVEAQLPAAVIARFTELSGLNDTSVIAKLPVAVQRVVLQGFADSMHTVFLTVFFFLIPAFIGAFFLHEVPLRTHAGIAASSDEPSDGREAEAEMDIKKAETAIL